METIVLNECTEISGALYCPQSLSMWLILTAGLLFVAGLVFVFLILRRKDMGFGPDTTRALGIVLFLPVLFFAIGYKEFSNEAIAALLGTLAGYVFSSNDRKDKM